jgi:nitrate reductase NapE component
MKLTDVQKELLIYVLFYVLCLIPILLVALIACWYEKKNMLYV